VLTIEREIQKEKQRDTGQYTSFKRIKQKEREKESRSQVIPLGITRNKGAERKREVSV
jgi:hypothetical protein